MEDTFNVRVDKVFGCLPAPPSTASQWRLTDEEIEKKEWNRDKGSPENDDVPKPYPSNFDGFYSNKINYKKDLLIQELEDELQDDDDDDDNVEEEEEKGLGFHKGSGKLAKPGDYDYDAWGIRTSIGCDCTLDNEEEDDEYDKLATGRDEAVDHLYSREITDYEADISSYNELPKTFRDNGKDPRANHIAAQIRLWEDAETAQNTERLPLSLNNAPIATDTQNGDSKDAVNLNSILRSKENRTDSKSKKRVRFDFGCKEGSEGTNILSMITSSREEAQGRREETSFSSQASAGVPDYVRNPSNYKHYTFDSSTDIDETSNQRAYMGFLESLKGPKGMEPEENIPFELPKSLTFTPKKKSADGTSGINCNEFNHKQKDDIKGKMHKKGFTIAVADEEAQESGMCEMEEDGPETAEDDRASGSRRPGRQYRTKISVDSDEMRDH